MKSFLRALAIIAILVGMISGYMYFKSYLIEKASHAIVVTMVHDVTANWNSETFKHYAEPGPITGETAGRTLSQSFALWSKLGPLDSGVNCEMQNDTSYGSGPEHYDSAIYYCAAHYAHGIATISITVRRYQQQKAGGWKISYFDVSMPKIK